MKGPRTGLTVALGVVAAMACGSSDGADDNQFRKDVAWCESAAAHVTQCCPGFVVGAIACRYYYRPASCDGPEVKQLPQLDESTAGCLRAMSCEDMVDRGVCARVAALATYVISGNGGGVGSGIPTGELCP